jgi:hypothetical protein
MVREGSGLLMQPAVLFSHSDDPVAILGKYGNISASMSPQVREVAGLTRVMGCAGMGCAVMDCAVLQVGRLRVCLTTSYE